MLQRSLAEHLADMSSIFERSGDGPEKIELHSITG